MNELVFLCNFQLILQASTLLYVMFMCCWCKCNFGTMGVTVGLLVLFVLGASLSCDARKLIITGLSSKETTASDVSVLQINHQESEGEVKASEEVVRIGNVCTMCEEFVTEALEYLKENKTQTEIIDILHNTCSRLLTFEEQVVTEF
ncbi:uncharacterized protein LOC114292381 isoform X2 [Camellia sinensis]|uniref:uncharacterized protein LOC114292381 isoform X2 n=1 Tax=Camellia sinensis TaxID=4442 RepID=UPI001035DBB1|nr:uncharacterized protein LOC114292381 isoform X2 [Camellia sinensis]